MIKVGITGQRGFVGSHLFNTLSLSPDDFQIVEFDRDCFEDSAQMDDFVKECDAIVHLAAMNRHEDSQVIYNTNIALVNSLKESIERTGSRPHVLFSSSLQEERSNDYGRSKKEGREIFSAFAKANSIPFTGLIIPNVFGPFGKPFYNSVIATFAHQVANNVTPTIDVDGDLKLIYVGELVAEIIQSIKLRIDKHQHTVVNTSQAKVSEILNLLLSFKQTYQKNGEIPTLKDNFELQLFNTYRCYMDIKNHFPVNYTQHTDSRGSFVELIRLGIGGQVSFSTTVPGITRGNHFHTRKIERFSVIKGKALIQLRKIGSDTVYDFYLDGDNPSYVDMPIWYTHNIKNIGEDVLYTNFWINEPFDAADPDTYFVEV